MYKKICDNLYFLENNKLKYDDIDKINIIKYMKISNFLQLLKKEELFLVT
jgi:hypothetical protein